MRPCVQKIYIYQDIPACYHTDKALAVPLCTTLLKCLIVFHLSSDLQQYAYTYSSCLNHYVFKGAITSAMQTVRASVPELVCRAAGEILHRERLLFSCFSLLWGCCVSQLGIIDLHGERYRMKPPNSPVISVSRSLNQVLS